jgi:hypothetical protein
MKIAAVFGENARVDPSVAVTRMCEIQRAHAWHKTEVFRLPGGAIGIVRTSEQFGKIPMLLQGEGGNLLAISGVPTMDGKLSSHLRSVLTMSSDKALEALSLLDGAYVALFWHASEKTLLLVPDFMGFQPVYVHQKSNVLAIASEIKAFPAGGVVPVEPDPAGWGAFVVFGHTVGEPTQLAGVSRIRGKRMRYTPYSNSVTWSKYWDWPQRNPDLNIDNVELEAIVDPLRKEIAAYQEYSVPEQTVLMSSGFDSRLTLCLLKEAGIPVNSFSVQQKGHYLGTEGKLGQEVARRLGVKDPKLVQPLAGKAGEIARVRYMLMNEVATASLSLFILKVAGWVDGMQGSVWEGFAPGYTIAQLTSPSKAQYLKSKGVAPEEHGWVAAKHVFSSEFLESMQSGLQKQVNSEFERYGTDDYGCMRFIFKNRALNRTGSNPFKVYTNSVLPMVPGLTRPFWNICASIPQSIVDANQKLLYKRIFQIYFPKVQSIPFTSEKNMFAADGKFHLQMKLIKIAHDLNYHLERWHKLPLIGDLGSQIKVNSNKNKFQIGSDFISSFLSARNLDDPCINADVARDIISRENISPPQRKLRNLFFYWALWHMVMQGELTNLDCSKYCSHLLGKNN